MTASDRRDGPPRAVLPPVDAVGPWTERPASDAAVPDAAAVVRAACPPLDGAVDALRNRVAAAYDDLRAEATRAAGDAAAPSEAADAALAAADLRAGLRESLLATTDECVETAAGYAADRLGDDLAGRLPGDADVEVAVDAGGTFAGRYARRQVERAVAALASAARSFLRRALAAVPGTTPDAGRVAAGAADVLAGWHPALVAGSATLWALRHGVQAVAEAVDLVAGKRWRVLEGGCPHHGDVDGSRTGVEECFVVPGDGGPRPAFVVGEDRPFGCRCLHEPVLGAVPDGDPRALAADDAVTVAVGGERVAPLTDRELEVYREHAAPEETFEDVVRRVHDEHSVAGGARTLGVTKKTLYRWLDKYVDGFDSYSGR